MTVYLPRKAWTSTAAPSGLLPLTASEVDGFAVHWPGTTTKVIGPRTEASIANLLEGYRRYHVSGRGWTDIAYQVAVDQAGRVWDLRGIGHRSAANGDTGPNRQWGAVLLLLGADEEPSPAMIRAAQDWRRDRWLTRYPNATRVVRHADVRPDATDCPGPKAGALVKDGTFLKEADDMPLTNDDAKKVFSADDVVTNPTSTAPVNPGTSAGTALGRIWADTETIKDAVRKLPGTAAMTPADRAAIVADLKAGLPTAADVAAELIRQLKG